VAFRTAYVVTFYANVYAYDEAFRQVSAGRVPGFRRAYHVCDVDTVPGRDLLVLATSTHETPLMAVRIPSLELEPEFKFPFPQPLGQYMPLYVKCLTPRYLLLRDETFFSTNDPRPYDTVLVDMEKATVKPTSLGPPGKDAVRVCGCGDCLALIECDELQVLSLETGEVSRSIRYPDGGRFDGFVVLADSAQDRLNLEGAWHGETGTLSQRRVDVDILKGTASVAASKAGVPTRASTTSPQRNAVMQAWAKGQRLEVDTTWVLAETRTVAVLDKFVTALPKDKEFASTDMVLISPEAKYILVVQRDPDGKTSDASLLSIFAADTAELIQSYAYDDEVIGVVFR